MWVFFLDPHPGSELKEIPGSRLQKNESGSATRGQ